MFSKIGWRVLKRLMNLGHCQGVKLILRSWSNSWFGQSKGFVTANHVLKFWLYNHSLKQLKSKDSASSTFVHILESVVAKAMFNAEGLHEASAAACTLAIHKSLDWVLIHRLITWFCLTILSHAHVHVHVTQTLLLTNMHMYTYA
jgi:hypothetical protein